ncbi:MAG TPA: sulfatase-like hydrolase/transferase [Bryobacteraceae bacterium]|nr:sulfatase-like hydrolase/transferase [Bryobacteraceae bacterium]
MTRRSFLAATGGSAAAGRAVQAQTAVARPNLLYILVDQLSGLALPGLDPHARMPNVAGLAKSGVTFTHAYGAAMTCGPARASLDTGLYTQTHGVGGGFQLAAGTPSLPRTLAAGGYVSSHPNGYSLESERAEHEKWLVALGYPQPLSSLNGAQSLARYLDLPLKWKCGRAGVAPEHGFDVYCAQRAIRFLETNKDKPFACFLQLRGPHDPYMTPRPFDTLVDPASLAVPPYRAGEFANKPPRQRQSFETQGASRMTDAQIRRILALYYGMGAYSDYAIGLVLKRLGELGLDERTVVILVADHGDTMGRHRFMSKDFAFYEPAVRIPFVVRAPGVRGGVALADPVSGIDLFPTLCDLMTLPKPEGLPGQSLLARWQGKTSDPARPIFAAQGVPGKNRAVMLRTPRFKLTRYDDGGNELYDLDRDADELNNRVDEAEYSTQLGQLTAQLTEWERRYPHRSM